MFEVVYDSRGFIDISGNEPGRIYTYPAKRWRKSKPFPPPDYGLPKPAPQEKSKRGITT